MRRILDGLRYDTETAEDLATWSNGYEAGNWHHEEETLHRSPKGQLFIHGWGGPLSGYSESHGNNHSGSERLWLVDENEAFEWLIERELDVKAEELFPGRVREG